MENGHSSSDENKGSLVKRLTSSIIPWKSSSLNIPEKLAKELISHARERAPETCWGVIIGQDLQAEKFHRLDEATAYCWGMELENLSQVQEQYQAQEQRVLAFYHSHSGEGGCPVILDTPSMANWPSILRHVVISLGDAEPPKLQVFRQQGKRFTEETASSFSPELQRLLARINPSDNKPSRRRLLLPPGSSGHK